MALFLAATGVKIFSLWESREQNFPIKSQSKADVFSRDDVYTLINGYTPLFQYCRNLLLRDKNRYIAHYSIDTAMQKHGETLFKRYHPKYGAIVAMDPVTGRVLSLISYTREDEDSLGEDLYCRSIFPAASIFPVGRVVEGKMA